MNVEMVNGKIGVERVTKAGKKQNTPFTMPEAIDSLGIIRFVSEGSEFKVGQKVYFGGKREEIRMAGMDIQVMEPSNIIAIVEDSHAEEAK